MSRIILVTFGISIVLSGTCTMAQAQGMEQHMLRTPSCHSAGGMEAGGACLHESTGPALDALGQCANGSCFLQAFAGDQLARNADQTSPGGSGFPPATVVPLCDVSYSLPSGSALIERGPPDTIAGVVLRL